MKDTTKSNRLSGSVLCSFGKQAVHLGC